MNSVFPLPRLPSKAQTCVLKSMCLLDIISFFRISKATKSLLIDQDPCEKIDVAIDNSKIYEFWLRPENYADLPLTMAFEMFKAKVIDVTRFCYHVRECREVPENLEEMCEYAVKNTHFPTLVQREDWINWCHYLEENVLCQTSTEFDEQEKKHEKNLVQYKQLLVEMDMRSGGTRKIMLFFDAQQKMMSVDPVKALAMVAPIQWTTYLTYTEQDRKEYRQLFTVEMSNLHYKRNVPERRARFLAAIRTDKKIRAVIKKRETYKKHYQKKKEIKAAKQAEKKAEELEKRAAIIEKVRKLNEIHHVPNEILKEILRLSALEGPSK